jgi:type I restriction enzyme S subunit
MKWSTVRLRDVALVQMGQSPPSYTYNDQGIGLPFFQGKADFGDKHPTIRMWCSSPIRVAENGDVLLSVRAPVGPTNVADRRCCIGRGLAAIRSLKPDAILPDFIRYVFKWVEPEISRKGQGSTFTAVKRKDVECIKFPLPPLSEQRRIVEILDQADALRKKRAEADAKAARILPALFYKMFGDPATNPKGWPVKRLGDPRVATINPKFSGDNVSADTEVSFVPMADVDEIWGRIVGKQVRKYSDIMRGFTPFRDGDVLFAKITPCMQNGKAAIARNLVNGLGFGSTEFHVLRAGPLVTPEWLFALVRLAWFRRQAESSFTGTAGQQRVPADFLARYEIGCPPIDLQRKFAKAVVHIQEWVHQKDRSRKGIEDLFAVLLHSAFTGDLTAKWREAHMKELLAEMEAQAKALELNEGKT